MPCLSFQTKKHKTSVKCAVANIYNYYGVKGDYAWHLASSVKYGKYGYTRPLLFHESDTVWMVGPFGGVQIISHDPFGEVLNFKPLKYITNNEKEMKEFMWVKLRAVPFVSK